MSLKMTRFLSILAIVFLIGISWYSIVSERTNDEQEYSTYVELARNKGKAGLPEESGDAYQMAISMKDSIGLRNEMAEMYYANDRIGEYLSVCTEMIDAYPTEKSGYEKYAEFYKDTKDYYSCYEVIARARRRGISSEIMDGIYTELANEYELTGGYADVGSFSNGLCAVLGDKGLWGYIDEIGKKSISSIFLQAGEFSSYGLAAVKDKDERIALIDRSGREKVVDTEKRDVEDATYLFSGKIALKYNGKYHYCDEEFRELFGEYDFAGGFVNGVAAVQNDGNWYVINENGERVSNESYEDIKLDDRGFAFRNGVAFAKSGGKYILIDNNCNRVGNLSWDDADAFNHDGELAAVCNNGKWGFVGKDGEMKTESAFEKAKSSSEGYAAVKMNDVWGYISESGKDIVIDYRFEEANDFNTRGGAFVEYDGYWQLLKVFRLSAQ